MRRLTEEEFAERLAAAEQSDASYSDGIGSAAHAGSPTGCGPRAPDAPLRCWSIRPMAACRLLTPAAQALHDAGRSSYKEGQTRFEWVTDMDAFDRCITPAFRR